MNESHREFLRQVEELLQASERRIAARFGKPDGAIDSCLAVGGTTSSSSTSSGSDISCVAEVPAPASFNPDISLVVSMDVADLANPTPARCSIEGSSRDNAELRSASAPATASTTSTATVDIIPMIAATAGSDGTLDGGATSGVASTPAICSMDCRPRHPMVASVLITSSAPTPTEYVLDTSSLHVAVVPLVVLDVFPAVHAPPIFAPTVHLQQLCNTEVFMLSSSQRITSKVPVHRPLPWPSFMGPHADGDEARPLPWPSGIGPVQRQSCLPSEPTVWSMFTGNHPTSGYIRGIVLCSRTGIYCLDGVLSIPEYWRCANDCVHSTHTYHTAFVWLPCTISEPQLLTVVRSLELKLFPSDAVMKPSRQCSSVGRSDLSGVCRDASHWHEYFVTEVHMHVNVVCSVWRLLIDSVTSVPFLNLAKKQPGELMYVSVLYFTKFSGMFRESLQDCDRFQWKHAWNINYYSLSRIHTRTTCVILLRSIMMGKLISAVVLPMIFLSNSYAAIVTACSPHSVLDHGYKWLMLCSTIQNKNLVYCCLSSHGHSEVVKWYQESAALLVYQVHTVLNFSSTSFRMLRDSSLALEKRQTRTLFLAAYSVMLQSTKLNSKVQSSWICEMPTENPSICTWFSICESSEGSCCCVIVSLGLHRTISLTDCGCLSSANVVLLRFYEKMDQIGFLLQGGTCADVLRLVSYKLWLENHQDTMQTQMVLPPCVHAFGFPVLDCCQNWQCAHSIKVNYKFDAIVLKYMGVQAVYGPIHVRYTASSTYDASYLKTVKLYMADREFLLLQDGIRSWADPENMAYAVLNKAFPAVDAPVCAGCTPPSIFDTSYPKQTAFYMGDRGLLFIGLATRK